MNEFLNSLPTFAIVPVLLAPAVAWIFTAIVALVTFVAGLLGIKLKNRGVNRVTEFLLNPRFLLAASVVSTGITLYLFFSGPSKPERPPIKPIVNNGNRPRDPVVFAGADVFAVEGQGDPIGPQDASEIDDPLHERPELAWKATGDNFYRGLTYDGWLWAAGDLGTIYAIEPESGLLQLQFNRASIWGEGVRVVEINSAVATRGDLIYVGEGSHEMQDGTMTCYEFADGAITQRWIIQTTGHTESLPLLWEDRAFFSAGGDGLYCCNAETGELIWRVEEKKIGHMDNFIMMVEGVLYIGSGVTQGYSERYPDQPARAAAVDGLTGEILWTIPILSSWDPPAYSRQLDRLIFPIGQIAKYVELSRRPGVKYESGLLFVTREGEVDRFVETDLPVLKTPIPHGDTLYVNLTDSEAEAQWYADVGDDETAPPRESNGSRVIAVPLQTPESEVQETVFKDRHLLTNPVACYGDLMVIPLLGGDLVGLQLSTREELWRVSYSEDPLEYPINQPLIRDASIYLASYAFRYGHFQSHIHCFRPGQK